MDANEVIIRFNFRPACEPVSPNLSIEPLTSSKVVKSRHFPSDYLEDKEEAPADTEQESHDDSVSLPKHAMPILDPKDLVGRTFLIPQEDGQHIRARIVKAIDNYDGKLQRDSTRLKFI